MKYEQHDRKTMKFQNQLYMGIQLEYVMDINGDMSQITMYFEFQNIESDKM